MWNKLFKYERNIYKNWNKFLKIKPKQLKK